MLDRDGEEVARATSLVRYAAESRFPRHEHGGGEEFFVLDGVFSDEHGDYPAGTYVHNPVGSHHAPFSRAGCTIWVKLHQMDAADDRRVVVDTTRGAWQPAYSDGLWIMDLHRFGDTRVALLRFDPGVTLDSHEHRWGEEFFVLDGGLEDELGTYAVGSWVRQPAGSRHRPHSPRGCVVLSKSGHLG